MPHTVLYGRREHLDPQLSPDGSTIAYLAPHAGAQNLWLHDRATATDRPLTAHTDDGIGAWYSSVSLIGTSAFYRWTADGKHIAYLRDHDGDEALRLHAVDVGSGETVDLTPWPAVQVAILAQDPTRPTELLILANRDDATRHDAWLIDVAARTATKVLDNPGWRSWLVGPDLAIVGGVRARADGTAVLERLDGTPVLELDADEAVISTRELWGLDEHGHALMLTSKGVASQQLQRIDLRTGEREIVLGDERYDIAYPVVDPVTRGVRAAVVVRVQNDTDVIDDSWAADLALARAAIGAGPQLQVVSRDLDDRTWIVEANDHTGLAYHLLDRDTRAVTPLFDALPGLRGHILAPQEPFTIAARDGLTLPGYIVWPPELPRRSLPAVVLVHGGPATRHTFGWSDPYMPVAQFLATRGIAVLEVDYRGSSGYGRAHLRAGDRERGRAMHTDLLDVLDWTVDEGWVDARRVAIMGVSYGGYAALVGATFTPERFRCAIDVCGPSDWLSTFEEIPPYWEAARASLIRQIGDPDTEPDFLRAVSPLHHADRIAIPLLVAHGANDPRVKQAQTDRIVEAARANGVECTYLHFPDEGHVFAKPESWGRLLEETATLLERHL
ncbi:MAG TPA: S9 family peptidase [Mycobacteriales bacterium]|nr:S9 family peptidase [Mycobacteriales bacterium]